MAIVRHIKTDILYRYLGDDEYRNLSTGAQGKVTPEMAKSIFVINLEATELINENPIIEELILKLNLKIDKT